jgi:hypothetical protein
VKQWQGVVENRLICESSGTQEEKYRQISERAGMKTITFHPTESGGFIGYGGFFVKGKKPFKIFGFNLMAIYFDPDGLHFLALLEANEEQIFGVIKNKYPGGKSTRLVYEYNPDNLLRYGHAGKHMADGGYNSNRAMFLIQRDGNPASIDLLMEVESCAETKSIWYNNICNMFPQKPLTWMGCAYAVQERMAGFLKQKGENRKDKK